jgi:hypothetical protein
MGSVGVSGCGLLRFGPRRRLELPLCAGVEGGQLRARGAGAGLSEVRTARSPWYALLAGPGLAWHATSRFALWLDAEAVVLLGRARFVTDQGTTVVHASPVGARVLAGVELRLKVWPR